MYTYGLYKKIYVSFSLSINVLSHLPWRDILSLDTFRFYVSQEVYIDNKMHNCKMYYEMYENSDLLFFTILLLVIHTLKRKELYVP